MNELESLDDAQRAVIDEIEAWFHAKGGPRIFRLFGAAGTGKTSLLPFIIARLRLPVYDTRTPEGGCRIAAYTNRAARVLCNKGLLAKTIHFFAGWKQPEVPPDAATQAKWKRLQDRVAEESKAVDAGERRVTALKQAQRDLSEFLRQFASDHEDKFGIDPDNCFNETELVILDEISMIDPVIGRIVEESCDKLLILGDPLQLGPPTSEDSYFIPKGVVPDCELIRIYRQDAGKLRDFLQLLRDTGDTAVLRTITDEFAPEVEVLTTSHYPMESLKNCDIALSRKHADVFMYNQRIRSVRTHVDERGEQQLLSDRRGPHPGEPIIALFQNVGMGLAKNDFCTLVSELRFHPAENLATAQICRMDDGEPIGPRLTQAGGPTAQSAVIFMPDFFMFHPGAGGKKKWREIEAEAKLSGRWDGTVKFTFAYAVTDFQSQGGEWNHVLMSYFDFKERDPNKAELTRFQNFRSLYTMASRARKRLTILIDP